MLRQFLRKHRQAVVTAVVTVVVAAVVAGAAVVSSGYHEQRVALGDGTVWVPSAQYGAVGRANTGVLQLNTAVQSATDTIAVVQSGSHVYSVDETKATVARVDVADATLGDAVTLPSGDPQVLVAGDTAIVGNGATGQLWSSSLGALGRFDASAKADLTLGADAVFDATDGAVAVYSPRTGTASLVTVRQTLAVTSSFSAKLNRRHDLQVATVGGHLAVLDRTAGVLVIDGRRVQLGAGTGVKPSLQRSSATGSDVTVATATGLVRVSPSGSISTTDLAVSGTGARPYVVGSCTYAAWAGGQAVDTCAGRRLQRLDQVPGGAALQILHNGSTIVANDPDSGRTWAIDRSGQLIDNWSDLVTRDDDQQQEEQTSDETPQVDSVEKPPVAVDDDLGARPGRTTVLPVLLNDYDPNGDPIVIDQTGTIDPSIGSLALIEDRQQIQITLAASATGTVSFPYTISDGNGGTATATVRVTVHPDSENSAPVQVRSTSADVVQNGHVSTNVLGDWVDPDGDPVYLASGTASEGDMVTTTPDGVLDFQDKSGATGKRTQAITVSDGRAEGHGSVTVDVATAGKVPLTADAFAVEAYAGKPLTVSPLTHVRGGNGTVTLTSVPSVNRVTITPSYDAGTFVFASDDVGDHQIDYTVTDGTKTATGVVRVTVLAPPDASSAPITTPKTVFVQTLSTKDTDVTATDQDPAGGVLLVTGLSGVGARSGVQASVIDQHIVRVTLTAPLSGAVTFSYEETNGLASTTGTVTVIEIPKPAQVQPPVAEPDSATVRVGDVTTIDVLANDSQPDGEALTLEPDLVQNVPGDAGLLFVSGNTLRYLAPETPGNYTAVYRVAGADGQTADAVVSIAVRERDAATNSPPVPETLTARVVAGQSVRITVPLTGIDPDGDSVQLVGVGSNPDKGSVTDVTGTSLRYRAGDYSAGTDEFTYTVVDALGARATGTVRVGIAPRSNDASNPVAVQDHVTIRPGGSVTVRVLQNDSDPNGGTLTVTKVEPNGDGVKARIIGGEEVRVTPPASARSGDFGVLYTASNDTGGASTAFVTVTVDPNAAPLRPEASDTSLDLQDILHRTTIDVNVLRNVFFAEGSSSALQVGLVPGYGANASVAATGRIHVRITNASQVIPFSVARRDDPTIVSYAFVHVPGFDDALPQVNRTAPAITVKSEASVRIDLSQYVVTANGRTATITDPSTVKATHASGGNLVVDSSTLTYTSAKLYFGQASISFEVTDGSNANGGAGRTATLVLPIRVTPRANQPPEFTGSTVEMQPGDTRTFDLTRLTNYPYPNDVQELKYSVVSRPTAGVDVSVNGQQMTVHVEDTTARGTNAAIGVGVADAASTGRSGTISVAVVGSTRPLAQPAADRAVAARGQTTSVDVLANDQATNPFPNEPLHVIAIRGLGAGLPAGLTVTPSADRSRLSVAVAANAQAVDTHLQYEVADATNDPDRYVWGDVTISVQDVPDQPSAPTRTGTYTGGSLTLTWSAPSANNAPITTYRITGKPSGGGTYTHDCGPTTVCTLTDLDPTQRYTFTVQAVNAIGTSTASSPSATLSDDYIPAASTSVTVTPSTSTPNRLAVTWNAVPRPSPGSAVTAYVVTLSGPTATQTARVQADTTTVSFDGLRAGGQYTATVSARNGALVVSDADWNTQSSDPVAAVGTPSVTPNIQATTTASASGTSNVAITHDPVASDGGATVTYSTYRLSGSGTTSCTSPAGTKLGGDPATDTNQGAGSANYAVVADNGYFCSIGYSGAVQTYQTPDNTPNAAVDVVANDHGAGEYDIRVVPAATGGSIDHYEIDAGSGFQVITGGSYVGAGGGYGVATNLVVRACGSPDSQFCTSTAKSFQTVATAVRTRASADNPVQGTTLVVDPPSQGAAVQYSYHIEFCAAMLVGQQCLGYSATDWEPTSGSAAPTVPTSANYVRVTATVRSTQDSSPHSSVDQSPVWQTVTTAPSG